MCGSKRFAKDIAKFCTELNNAGVLVFEPSFDTPVFEDKVIGDPYITSKVFKGLTLEHFDWIRKSDVCYIYNPGRYIGVSVTMEMAFASALSKPIFALSPETGDPCSAALIDKVVTSKELLNLL